jgi:hypothetical protein
MVHFMKRSWSNVLDGGYTKGEVTDEPRAKANLELLAEGAEPDVAEAYELAGSMAFSWRGCCDTSKGRRREFVPQTNNAGRPWR